jgi:hypothetical protein
LLLANARFQDGSLGILSPAILIIDLLVSSHSRCNTIIFTRHLIFRLHILQQLGFLYGESTQISRSIRLLTFFRIQIQHMVSSNMSPKSMRKPQASSLKDLVLYIWAWITAPHSILLHKDGRAFGSRLRRVGRTDYSSGILRICRTALVGFGQLVSTPE